MNDFTLHRLALERAADLLRDADCRRLADTARTATRDRAQAVRSRPAATGQDTPPARRTARDTEPCAAC